MKEVEQLKLNKARATQLTQTTEATQLTNGRDATKCVTIITGMGATMGLLTLLLAVMTVGWAWTCWVTKKEEKLLSTQNKSGKV